jgi:hypothetical protein
MVVVGAIRSEASLGAPPGSEPQFNQVPHMQMTQSARRRPMKGKTTVPAALLFALSLSPAWVLAESTITTLPLLEDQYIAAQDIDNTQGYPIQKDKVFGHWGEDNPSGGLARVRHPLAVSDDDGHTVDCFYKIDVGGGCD